MQVQQVNPYGGLSAFHLTVATRWRSGLRTRFCKFVVTVYRVNCSHTSLGNSSCADIAQLHAVLGVGPGASKIEIKRAYRRLALKYHQMCVAPSALLGLGSLSSHLRFLHIKAAYDLIMNPNPTDFAIGLSSHLTATPSASHWCGEAGPDDWFSSPCYSTSEEAPTYDPWWELPQQSMTSSTYGPVRTDSDFSAEQLRISWEDW